MTTVTLGWFTHEQTWYERGLDQVAGAFDVVYSQYASHVAPHLEPVMRSIRPQLATLKAAIKPWWAQTRVWLTTDEAPLYVLALVLGLIIAWYFLGGRKKKGPGYESSAYWNDRYRVCKEEEIHKYEWYFIDSELVKVAVKLLEASEDASSPSSSATSSSSHPIRKRDQLILELGCGQSSYSEKLYDAGYRHILATDFSHVCISERIRLNTRPKLNFLVVDARSINYPTGTFDMVVEKATLDSIIYSRGAAAKRDAARVMSEIHRVLKPGGTFLAISLNNPDTWTKFCDHEGLKPYLAIDSRNRNNPPLVRQLNNKHNNFYVYVAKKV